MEEQHSMPTKYDPSATEKNGIRIGSKENFLRRQVTLINNLTRLSSRPQM